MSFDTSQFAADLPPPRDDEPATLRRDIVDELADHLECALRREQLTNTLASGGRQSPVTTTDSPWQRVLTRFGNPKTVARQLWFDAMKERLMAQKVMILLASVATAAVVFLSVAMWRTLERSQDAQRLANESQLALIQQHEQFTAGILQKLESLRAAPAPAAASVVDGWTPLTVKLVSEAGEPVEGEVQVTGTPIGGDSKDINISRSTDPGGIAECGMVPYGNYRLKVTATAAEETHTEHVMVAPGQPSERTVVCPASPPPDVEMKFAFNPPEELGTDQLRYLVNVEARPRRIGGTDWSSPRSDAGHFWVDASGQILSGIQMIGRGFGGPATVENGLTGLRSGFAGPPLREYVYVLESVAPYIGEIPVSGRSYSVYGHVARWAVSGGTEFYPPTAATFEPHPGAENVWKIDIPDDVWAAAFEAFRASPHARHVTIPDGWVTVSLVVSELAIRRVVANLKIGSTVNIAIVKSGIGADKESTPQPLIDSAQLIAIDHPQSVGGFEEQKSHFVFMVTPEQRAAIEELKTLDNIRFELTPADAELDTPVLHEVTLEKFRRAAKSDEAVEDAGDSESQPATGGT